MPRTSNVELPTAAELWEILDKESQRLAVRYDFLDLHPDIFQAFRSLCDYYDIGYSWISSYRSISLEELVESIHETIDSIEDRLLANPPKNELLDTVYDSLDTDAEPAQADAIFVFGAPSNLRIDRAIELYKAGYAKTLILSGHGPHYGNNATSEADRMSEYAIEQGVPETAILIENQAVTIPDNVKRALDLFESRGEWPEKMLIVASPFVLRRCEMEWFKFSPQPIEIISVASDILSPELSRDGWSESSHGIRVVMNEYAKLVIESKMDLLRAEANSVGSLQERSA